MAPAGNQGGIDGDSSAGPDIRSQVAWACRILADEGYRDLTLGHVSARDPERPDQMWIKRRGVSLGEVSPVDVIEFGIDADPKSASDEMHLEAVLHSAVYRQRDDVDAVVHGHPPFTTAFAATEGELLHLTHDAVMFDRGLAVFDGTPGLITEVAQGVAVADALGENVAVLLRNHGVLVAHRSIPWLVLAAVTLERAVMLQSVASTLGEPSPIARKDVEELHRHKYNDGLVDEYWQAWIRDLSRRGLDFEMEVPA